jgi:hypothetical protein
MKAFQIGILSTVLLLAVSLMAGPQRKEHTIKLIKPDLIYVDGNVVSPERLRTVLGAANLPIRIELDPEVRLEAIESVQRTLLEVKAPAIRIEAAGTWILDALIQQRKERQQTK